MISYKNSLVVFSLAFLCFSCKENNKNKFEELNSLMETNPSKGLVEVYKRINDKKYSNKHDKKQLELLKFKGEDKCGIIHTSEDSINELLQYFEKKGSIGERIETHYYMGSTYRDKHNYPLAITYYNKAIKIGETNTLCKTDSMVLANVYSQLSGLNDLINNQSLALEQTKHALDIRKRIGIDDVASYQDVANSYYRNGIIDSAEYYYKQCLLKIVCDNSIKENINYIGDQLQFFSNINNEKLAKLSFEQIKSISQDSIPSLVMAKISQYYLHIDFDIDSCIYYSELAFEQEKDYAEKAINAKNLSMYYAYKDDYETSVNYSCKYYLLEDSAKILLKKAETATAQNLFQAQEIDRMRNELASEQAKKNEYIAYGMTAGMTMLTLLCISYYIQNKRKLKYLENIEKLEADKEEIEIKHNTLTEIVEADNKLRAESAKDVSSVLAHLNEIEYDQKAILSEDMWEDVFLAVDKIHPNLRNHILSYYKDIDNKDLILIYLTVIGLKQANAARLFKNARSVVNRKYIRLNTRLGASLNDMLQEYKEKYEENAKDISV